MLKIAINKSIVNKATRKQATDLTEKWDNAELGAEEFRSAVLDGNAFCCSQLKSAHKATDQFFRANSVWLDFDNKDTGHKTTLDRVINSEKMKQMAFAVYTSPSHTPDQHRFRLVFQLPYDVTDPNEYKSIVKLFINKYGSDPAPSAAAQAFFGNTNAEVYLFGQTVPEGFIDQLRVDAQKEKEETKVKHNGNINDAVVRQMLAAIPKKTDYVVWSKLCHAVNAAVEYNRDLAAEIINEWSPGRGNEVMSKLKTPMKDITAGTLVYYAKENGWEPPEGFYKQKSKSVVNADGVAVNIENKLSLVEFWLNQHHSFKYNLVNGRYEMIEQGEWHWLTDRDINEIWRSLQVEGIKYPKDQLRTLIESKFSEAYDPIKDYFSSLPDWDNEDHIADLCARVPVPEDFIVSWYDYLRRWLIASYRCAMNHKPSHLCLVLQSTMQGIGKTTFLNKLCPPELNKYLAVSQNFDADNKDAMIMLSEKFMINMDELESVSRKEISALKSMISMDEITTRRPYGHFSEVLVRRASFCGSINNTQFLTDMTGSRRFLVVPVVDVIAYKESIDYERLWSQVKALANNPDERSWYEGEEIKVVEANNEQFQLKSSEEEIILEYFEPAEDTSQSFAEALTATEVCSILASKVNVRLNPVTLGKALHKLGFLKQGKRAGASTLYKWIVKKKGGF